MRPVSMVTRTSVVSENLFAILNRVKARTAVPSLPGKGKSILPSLCGRRPTTRARYSLSTLPFSKRLSSSLAVCWSLATTRRPEVSWSRRWTSLGTTPALSYRASKIPRRVSRLRMFFPSWTASPAGLSRTISFASSKMVWGAEMPFVGAFSGFSNGT